MMKSEFENLAGREVTNEQYRAIETLYMSSNLEKAEFVKSIRTMLKSIPQPERKKDIKRMVVRDRSGYRKTPNGCYYHIEYVELVDMKAEKAAGQQVSESDTETEIGMNPPEVRAGDDYETPHPEGITSICYSLLGKRVKPGYNYACSSTGIDGRP